MMGMQNLALTVGMWFRAAWTSRTTRTVVAVAVTIGVLVMLAVLLRAGGSMHTGALPDDIGNSWAD